MSEEFLNGILAMQSTEISSLQCSVNIDKNNNNNNKLLLLVVVVTTTTSSSSPEFRLVHLQKLCIPYF